MPLNQVNQSNKKKRSPLEDFANIAGIAATTAGAAKNISDFTKIKPEDFDKKVKK